MKTKKDKILEKLRKLMNLKESATALGNESEANAAAAGITRLLMEYNLTENDIPEQEKLENPIVSEEIPFKISTNGRWYSDLISVVCEYNMCRSLIISKFNNGRMKRSEFEIIGRKKNVEVVLYLISFLSHQFIAIGKRNYEEYKHDCIWKYGKSPKSLIMYLKSFLYGCVIGLSEKFDESKRILETENNITALVRTTKSEIDDFLKGEKIGKARESKSDIDALCAMRGIETGKNVEICKGIHAEFVSENLRLQ